MSQDEPFSSPSHIFLVTTLWGDKNVQKTYLGNSVDMGVAVSL